MGLLYAISFLAAALTVLGDEEICPEPREACQWSGHNLGAAWSDAKFSGPNYRRGYHTEHYAECCDLCNQAVGCYKFHVVQVVAADIEEPGSGLVNCFLHGQGAKEVCYNILDPPLLTEVSTDNSTDNPNRKRRRLQIGGTQGAGGSVNTLNSGSSGTGDPHLVGFDGRPFDFQGYTGGVFNLINQKSHSLNMLLTDNGMSGLTFIRALALQYGDKRVKVEAAPFRNSTTGAPQALLTVEVNGMAVEVAALDTDNEPARLEAGDVWVSTRRFGNNTQEVHVTTPGLQIVVTKERNSRHLDLTASILRSDMEPMHGVLGQTYKFNATFAQFQGDEIDYLVSGLWATDCKYCTLFAAEPMPAIAEVDSQEDGTVRRVLVATDIPLKKAQATAEMRPKDWAHSSLFTNIR